MPNHETCSYSTSTTEFRTNSHLPQNILNNVFAGTYNLKPNPGGLGVLWDKNVAFCFVRPTRHTYGFMNQNETFTLSFFDERYRSVLAYCGSHSGKHVNKVQKCGITPVAGSVDDVYFAEARLVLECRKIYFADINPSAFLAQTLTDVYPEKDYHRMFIGEIEHVLGREPTKS